MSCPTRPGVTDLIFRVEVWNPFNSVWHPFKIQDWNFKYWLTKWCRVFSVRRNCKFMYAINSFSFNNLLTSQELLGRGSNNQNGNLRWILPWRGGGLACHKGILKKKICLKPSRITPWLPKLVLHIVWALCYVYMRQLKMFQKVEYHIYILYFRCYLVTPHV